MNNRIRFNHNIHRLFPAVALILALALAPPAIPEAPAETDQAIEAALSLQNAFTRIAEEASEAVVVITNKQVQRQRGGVNQLPPEFRFFFGIPEPREQPEAEQAPRPAGRGSGFFVSEEGYLVTNYHVIKDHAALEVQLRDGTVYDSERDKDIIEVVGVDPETDLAVLRIHDEDREGDYPILKFADSDKVKVGQWAIAVGAPFNFDYSVTVGVVSQKGRYNVRLNTYENYIQTDASINPGNSGGPLLNLHGEVVGVNDFIVTGGGMSRGNVGLGFAISSNLAGEVVDSIIETGAVIRPWLGIAMQPLSADLKEQFEVQQGVLVSDVIEGDPADKAGIKPGDVVTSIGDQEVNSPHDLQFAVLKYNPGDEIPVTLIRDNQEMTLQVIARRREGRREREEELQREEDLLEKLGVALQDTNRGVAVARVVPGSKADAAGLQRGDIVLEVNRQAVQTVSDALAALRQTQSSTAVLYVDRRGNKFFAPLRLDDGR